MPIIPRTRLDRYCAGGWLGLHGESNLILFILMLLLWEEVFDCGVEAAVPHCIMVRTGYLAQPVTKPGAHFLPHDLCPKERV